MSSASFSPPSHDVIAIKGAREHNLKNISLSIPRNRLVVITGLSGSGKSSLAFDTIFAEGQRRYVESLSSYARQFLQQMEKPDVDHIDGLSPAVSIEQKTTHRNPRSTVGTVTEIYDYLRLLFARVGTPHCYKCGKIIQSQTPQSIVDSILALPEATRVQLMAPMVRQRKGSYTKLFDDIRKQGYTRVRVNGDFKTLDEEIKLDRYKKHDIDVVIDRLTVHENVAKRMTDSVETALRLGEGLIRIWHEEKGGKPQERLHSEQFACDDCGISFEELQPRMFSFNNPHGACPECTGLGFKLEMDPELLVTDPLLSLSEGAIAPWDALRFKTNKGHRAWLECLVKPYGANVKTPWKDLTAEFRDVVLFGSKGKVLEFLHNEHVHKYPYEGLVRSMERLFHQTQSDSQRDYYSRFMSSSSCKTCKGARLRPESRAVTVADSTIMDVTGLQIGEALKYFNDIALTPSQMVIAERILKEIRERLGFLTNVGLEYLSLSRGAGTLSGGESQRIRLATQVGAGLVGVLYVLDEPSIGLHQRDNQKLIATLTRLRDIGNTVIVVEHDEETIYASDYVVDLGPGAGVHGGEIVAMGTPKEIMKVETSMTGQFLSGRFQISMPAKRRVKGDNSIVIRGASHNNLRGVDASFPLGLFVCVTGVSGSGKSSLINQTLFPAVRNALRLGSGQRPGKHKSIDGLEYIDKVIDIDQSPIGRTPRSNAATYTDMFTPIRYLFSQVPESRARGYTQGRFSFNVKGGRCEECEGDGMIRIAMHFLPDVFVPCETCKGARYNRDTLDIRFKGKTIAEVLDMNVEDACEFFASIPAVYGKVKTLREVGLGYIKLGQPATTLSGGEAQRVKLASELSRRSTGRTLYILDEPTTGLHAVDIDKLLQVLHRLVDTGNTVIVIEHNLDVIKTADWIVDLGPEGGDRGGLILVEGTPEQVVRNPKSHTGRFLKDKLKSQAKVK